MSTHLTEPNGGLWVKTVKYFEQDIVWECYETSGVGAAQVGHDEMRWRRAWNASYGRQRRAREGTSTGGRQVLKSGEGDENAIERDKDSDMLVPSQGVWRSFEAKEPHGQQSISILHTHVPH